MASSDNITVPKGDYGYNLNFTLRDSDGDPRIMTGYEKPKFKTWAPGTPGTLLVSADCEWTVQAEGTCYYLVVAEDFDDVGRYCYEIEVTKLDGEDISVVESAKKGWVTVEESG